MFGIKSSSDRKEIKKREEIKLKIIGVLRDSEMKVSEARSILVEMPEFLDKRINERTL